MSELDLPHGSYTDGLDVHGSMFLAIDGDITAAETRFLGRLAGGWILCEGGERRGGKRKGGWDGIRGRMEGRESGREG